MSEDFEFEHQLTKANKPQEEIVELHEREDESSMFEGIFGSSPALRAVLSRLPKVAATDTTVLISVRRET